MKRLQRCRARETDRRVVWQSASLLLAYPDSGFIERLDVVEAAASTLDVTAAEPLLACVRHLRGLDEIAAASQYVETFDWRRSRALFLSYYTAGDTRNRGMALLEFANAYRRAGIEPPADELPDHLAVVLEFAATVDESAGHDLLLRHRTPINLLVDALTRIRSCYAPVVAAVAATLPAATDRDLRDARRLAEQGPPVESVGLEPFAVRPGPVDLGPHIGVREAVL